MDIILSYLIRLIVWFSKYAKPLSRFGLIRYEEWHKGKPCKVLLVGYNGARNTGADARVVALTQQLEEAFGTDELEITLMTLDTENIKGYFSKKIHLYPFSTMFFYSLFRAASQCHAAVLCEGSTLTRTFADALCLFYCEAAGIMKRQGKPCIAYGSEVGHLDGWLAKMSRDMCNETYFVVRTETSLQNLNKLGLKGHVGTDTAWTLQTENYAKWAAAEFRKSGWDGIQPLMGVAVINPYCWPVRPSVWRWVKSIITRDYSQQYDSIYYYSVSDEREKKYKHYLMELATAVNRYQRETNAFVVIFGMERLDKEACKDMELLISGSHTVQSSNNRNVFEMTSMLRQMTMLVTSRYHAAVLSMDRNIPIIAISMDGRLDGIMNETGLSIDYLHHVDDDNLGNRITESLNKAEKNREEISDAIKGHVAIYKNKTKEMTNYFATWLRDNFS